MSKNAWCIIETVWCLIGGTTLLAMTFQAVNPWITLSLVGCWYLDGRTK